MNVNDNGSARKDKPADAGSWKDRWSPFVSLFVGLCLLLVGLLIFREFLFGSAVLLYKDIGSDSLNTSYPYFVHLSDYIRSEGIPSWSFYVGMGQDLSFTLGGLILNPVIWLPREFIAQGLVFQHLLKVLIAGLLFLRFLQLRGVNLPASLLGSLLLSYSAYMCMGSCWYGQADEVICFTGLLLGAEKGVKQGTWPILALTVALVGLLGPFHLYLCALFLLFYVPARLFARYGWQPRLVLRACAILAAGAVLGVGLSAVVTLPHLYTILNSPRGSGTTSYFARPTSFPVFGLESRLHYITAALRIFANDALGTADEFRGWANYFESPLTYCGLLSLVMFPQVFTTAPRRHRATYALFLAGIIVPIVFPWFRYLFWLFQGDYYRAYSLFSILGLITLAVIAFSRYVEARTLNLWVLAATTLVLVGILCLPIGELQSYLNPILKLHAAILLLSYSTLLAIGQLLKRQTLAAWLIVCLTAVELILFDRITVSTRPTVSREELKARVGYNDEIVDAVRDIKVGDGTFFRITKLRPSGLSFWRSLNDAMVFGYYGTSSYSSFNSVNYTNFLTAVGAIPPNSESLTRWALGLNDNALLATFACEKYALVDDPVLYQTNPQYDEIRRYGKDYLFLNQLFLPLGLTFNRSMAEDVFRQLPDETKAEALLRTVVLSNGSEAEKYGLSQLGASEVEQEIKATSLSDVVSLRRDTALSLTSFRQTRIAGTVRLDQRSILVLQTPFDRGWRALQDGHAAPVLKVDVGLLGVALDAGEHKVELRYSTPFRDHGLVITLASFLVLAATFRRWPRLRWPA